MMKRMVLAVVVLVVVAGLHYVGSAGADEAKVQAARGKVVAVTEGSKTVVVESTLGGKPWIVGCEVTDETKFAGKAKGLQDVKAGDDVTVRWVREEHRLAARSLTVR